MIREQCDRGADLSEQMISVIGIPGLGGKSFRHQAEHHPAEGNRPTGRRNAERATGMSTSQSVHARRVRRIDDDLIDCKMHVREGPL